MATPISRPTSRPFQDPESRAASPTKALVYFANNPRGLTFYGFYNSGRYTVGEEQKFEYSKQMLIKRIDQWGVAVVRAILYDNLKPGRPEIGRKEYGAWSWK